MTFFEMSPEVAAAAADLYRVRSPRYQCPCGFSTFDGNEHRKHRTGGGRGPSQYRHDVGCQALWSNR